MRPKVREHRARCILRRLKAPDQIVSGPSQISRCWMPFSAIPTAHSRRPIHLHIRFFNSVSDHQTYHIVTTLVSSWYLDWNIPPLILYWSSQHGNTCSHHEIHTVAQRVVSIVVQFPIVRYATYSGDRQISYVHLIIWAMEESPPGVVQESSSCTQYTHTYPTSRLKTCHVLHRVLSFFTGAFLTVVRFTKSFAWLLHRPPSISKCSTICHFHWDLWSRSIFRINLSRSYWVELPEKHNVLECVTQPKWLVRQTRERNVNPSKKTILLSFAKSTPYT
jgi:hypothetical protein